MKSLAELLGDLGCAISGSDHRGDSPTLRKLRRKRWRVDAGHDAAHLPADVDALIYSPAIPASNPERQEARRRGIPQFSLIEVLAKLMETRTGVCIAGTHGKSTTTAMTAWILQHAGRSPSAFVGAGVRISGRGGWAEVRPESAPCDVTRGRTTHFDKPVSNSRRMTSRDREGAGERIDSPSTGPLPDGRGSFSVPTMREVSPASGTEDLFVVESCEYQRNFLQFQPQHAVILGIEPDHFDTFPDEAALVDGFRRFVDQVSPTGTLLVSGDCERCRRIVDPADARLETFGADSRSLWWFDNARPTDRGTRFRVFCGEQFVAEIELPLFGRHHLHNALAAVAMSVRLGVPAAKIRAALREFPGIARRFALVGSWRGMLVFDDYAHHPTAVRVTLKAARERFPGRRLWCVFQPHQIARTTRLMNDFAAALCVADHVLVTPVFAARETDAEAAVDASQTLAAKTAGHNGNARLLASLDQILPTLEDEARPGDVVVLMGAGDIERIGHELAGRISRDHSRE